MSKRMKIVVGTLIALLCLLAIYAIGNRSTSETATTDEVVTETEETTEPNVADEEETEEETEPYVGKWQLKSIKVNDVELSVDELGDMDLGEDGAAAINTSFEIDKNNCLTLYKDGEEAGYDTFVKVKDTDNQYTLKHDDSYKFTLNDDGTISLDASSILVFEKVSDEVSSDAEETKETATEAVDDSKTDDKTKSESSAETKTEDKTESKDKKSSSDDSSKTKTDSKK